MKPRLYLETTIVSYLTARPSHDPILAGMRAATQQWWVRRSREYDLFVSDFVWDEARGGDVQAAQRRVEALTGLPVLPPTPEVLALANDFVRERLVPPAVKSDALHVAIAAVHRMHFLLTWNCRHIAKPEIAVDLDRVCKKHGLACPVICTPHELLAK